MHLRGFAAAGAAATLVVTGFVVATPSYAVGQLPQPADAMTLTPATGNHQTLPSFATSGSCPAQATHTYVQLFGPGLPDAGQIIRDVSRQGTGTSGGFTLEATRRFQDVVEAAGQTAVTPGLFRTELVCSDASLAKYRRFTADLRFTSATAYTTDTSQPNPEPTQPNPGPTQPNPQPVPPGTIRPITNACPAGTPQAGFADVPRDNLHAASIDCVVFWRVAAGRSASEYAPTLNVNRGQMARFIANVIRESGGSLPAGPDRFRDDNGNQFEADINALVQAGVVGGRADGSYGPNDPVFRDQMATFLVNAYQFRTGKTLGASRDYYSDDAGNVHEPRINRAAEAGFTGGTGGTGYSPRNLVRRDAMGSFLARVLDKLVAEDGARRRA